MSEKKTVLITNRSNSVVVYKIPDLNVRRTFAVGETKKIPLNELVALTYRPGGTELIQDVLLVRDEGIAKQMPIDVEPEYFLEDQQVIDMLRANDNLDQFLDCLDFAPVGVKDLIKKYAVELPVFDSRKRDAIKEKLGFDVDAAIRHLAEAKAEEAGAQ